MAALFNTFFITNLFTIVLFRSIINSEIKKQELVDMFYDKEVCDNCGKNPPSYTSGDTQLCEDCARDVGWVDAMEDW